MKSLALVIPLKNEEASIDSLIASIRNQSLQPAEIILVDGGSTDRTVARLKQLFNGDEQTKIIEAGKAMPGKGRNIGTEATSCEWIAYTDAGIRLDKYWLEKLVTKALDNPDADVIYGNFNPELNTFFSKCASIAYVPPARQGSIRSNFIASSLVRKAAWKMAGGFPDWRAAEDLIFMENLKKGGAVSINAPDAMVYWQLRPSLGSTYSRFDLYSKYNVWAGRQAYWHYGVAKQYLVVAGALLLAVFHSIYWLLALPLWMAVRVGKRLIQHRQEIDRNTLLNPACWFMVMLILITLDLATFSGWLKALLRKAPGFEVVAEKIPGNNSDS